jgi:uncharacterized protein YndB with AHSA1/START domain
MAHLVEVSVIVCLAPADVFSYFTRPQFYTRWMGSEAMLDPVPGGAYAVRMADGFAAAGEFVSVEAPRLVSFTWGFADDEAARKTKNPHAADGQAKAITGSAMPAGSTRVTVTFAARDGGGTLVTLRHDGLPTEPLRHGHQIAWETYLPRLAITAAGGDPGPDPHA